MRWLAALTTIALWGCGEELVEPGRMRLVSGHEPDPWAVSPAPDHAVVFKESGSGEPTELASGPAPLTEFSLGQTGAGHYSVTGLDAAEVPRVRARSLKIDPAGFAGGTLPLFVARAGELARPPGELASEVGASPLAASLASRHLLLVRGGAAGLALDGYDLAAWRPIEPTPLLDCGAPSCEPRSLAVALGSLALAVGDGWGFWFDPIVGDSSPIAPPDGLASWADVAGGATVTAPDGSTWIIGGTRAEAPSAEVLAIAVDGTLSHLVLSSPRQGATAIWVDGRGLVVVGGGDASAAGAELLADGAKTFMPLPQPPDQTRGAALVVLGSARLLRVGGRQGGAPAPSVELALGCAASCSPEAAGDEVDLAQASAFPLGSGRALVIGSNDAGETRVFRWEDGQAVAVELREPRSNAAAVLLPSGHVGIAGGTLPGGQSARSIELYLE